MKKLILFLLIFSLSFNCFAAYISNADILDEDMADITDWTADDGGTGISSQITFEGQSCMKLDSGTVLSDYASRTQDVGSFGSRTVFSIKSYYEAIGPFSGDVFSFYCFNGTIGLYAFFGSDGLFISDGAQWSEIGTDLVSQDVWQEWTFDVNWVAQTVDVYLNQVLQVLGVSCSQTGDSENGVVLFEQIGINNANRITYIDWFKAGSDFESPNVLLNGSVTLNGNVTLQ